MPVGTLRGRLSTSNIVLNGSIRKSGVTLKGNLKVGIASDIEIYKGPYTVTPDPNHSLNLNTGKKYLEQNITVKKIPYYEASNLYGTTVHIGEEL